MRTTGTRLASPADAAEQAARSATAVQLTPLSFGGFAAALGSVAAPLPDVAGDILTALSRATTAVEVATRRAADAFEDADLEAATAAQKRAADLEASGHLRG